MAYKDIEELNAAVENGEITSPLKAIRAKCLDCSCYSVTEVKECFVKKCPLYPFRMGKNPFRKVKVHTDEEKAVMAERLAKARTKLNK